MSTERFIKCTKDSGQEFIRYDRDVDIVTSWERFSQAYKPHFTNFNFDRFPSYKQSDDQWLNPNFTIFFDRRYAAAFETYHREGIIEIPTLFEKEVDKWQRLADDFKFEDRDGKLVHPDRFDIVLIVDSGHSQTLGHKIKSKLDDGLSIEPNIILIEWSFIEDDQSLYRFKRLSHPDQNFRDDILPKQGRISRKLSMQGEYERFENIQIPINDEFVELKATGMFTNHQTSELYLACRLWDTIVKDKLTDEEWQIWQKEDPKKQIKKEVSCETLADEINNKYVPGANISAENVKDALRYISVAKRAIQISDDKFRVKYSNLIEKRREHKDAPSERSDIEDLAYLLASWYCETKVGNSPKEIAEIITSESFNTADLSGITGNEKISY